MNLKRGLLGFLLSSTREVGIMSPSQSRTMTLALTLCLGGVLAIASAVKQPNLSTTVTTYALGD